jgi:serine/threonine-protein kinase
MTQASGPGIAYPAVGEVVDAKYRVEELIGLGGMGAVARATHLVRRAPVALKFMSAHVLLVPGAVERFINEAVAASRIDSDHIVRIFDTGTLPSGAPYLVMEYLEGIDLANLLGRHSQGRLPTARAVHFVLQMLRGLQIAHAAGIVHRDMKPANCFVVNKDGEPDFVKLLDFGISKVRQAGDVAITQENAALGTPLYMSPEQARSPRDADPRSDLYSTGVILYELLTGVTPVVSTSGELNELLYKLFTSEAPPIQSHRPDLPDGLAAVVHRALVHDPDARFATAADMAEALAPWADERSAAVLAKIRATMPGFAILARGSTHAPPVGGTVATAATEASGPPPPRSDLPPRPGIAALTDLGSTKDTPDSRSAAGSAQRKPTLAIGLGIGAAVLVAGIVAIFFPRPSGVAPTAASSATGSIARVLPPPTSSAIPETQTTPLPSASAAVPRGDDAGSRPRVVRPASPTPDDILRMK